MANNTNSSRWLAAHIKLDPILEEAAADFIVGVMAGAVEQSVDTKEPDLYLNVFFEEKNLDEQSKLELQNKLEQQMKDLADIFKVKAPAVSWELIEDQDWSNNWKVHFKPFEITQGLIIAPTWEKYQAKDGEKVITMDPGMAFGTGHHATTSLSLDFLRKIIPGDGKPFSVLDVGCGTAILGMGAVLFGAKKVVGIDNDPEAVQVAIDNVKLNECQTAMKVSQTPLCDLAGQFNCIVANIIHDVLLTMKDDFKRLLAPDGDLILSGILSGKQEENIIREFENSGFIMQTTEKRGEWFAIHLKFSE